MAYSPIWAEYAKRYGLDPKSFNGHLPEYQQFRSQWNQQHPVNGMTIKDAMARGWKQSQYPGQWTLDTRQSQSQSSTKGNSILNQLVGIRNQLANQKPVVPPAPVKPTLSGFKAPAPVDYVQEKRLLEGKGLSKFKNQARGTDRFSIVRNLVNQYFPE